MSEAKEEAVHAIVDFVKAPDMFQVSYTLIELNDFISYYECRYAAFCGHILYIYTLYVLST